MSEEGGTTLKALADRPELEPQLEWLWDAFWDLSSDRQVGFSAGPIMWASLDAYARRHRINGAIFNRFVSLLRKMDREFLKVSAEMAKAAAKA